MAGSNCYFFKCTDRYKKIFTLHLRYNLGGNLPGFSFLGMIPGEVEAQ